jgi:hypothetical protein
MYKTVVLGLILLVFLVSTSYAVKVVNTYSSFDLIVETAPVVPPVIPGGGGGGGGGSGGEQQMQVCGDGIIHEDESCETCPVDFEFVYGPNFCDEFIYNETIDDSIYDGNITKPKEKKIVVAEEDWLNYYFFILIILIIIGIYMLRKLIAKNVKIERLLRFRKNRKS